MLNARIVTIVAVFVSILPLVAPALSAQDAATLPPGIQSIDVDGQALDSVSVPVTNNTSPEISGRLESPVPVIELAVGDAEPIRFSAEVDERGRFRAAVPQALADGQYSLAINDIPVGIFSVDSTAQVAADEGRQREDRVLLDIARVVPYPVDFGDVLPGLGFLDGRFFTIDEEAARTAAANDDTSAAALRETRRALAEGGWLQRYENRLAVPNPENADVFDVQVSSFVVEYATPEAASAAFAALTGDDQPVESPPVGDESVLSLLTGVTPDTGAEYQAARLMFRVGPMLGMIIYADLLGQQVDLALLDSVAQAVAGRGAVVAERGSEPLGVMALRLDPSPATDRLIRRDLYDVRAGALTPLFAEDETVRESRVGLLTGTTDAFSSTTNGTFAIAGGQDRGERQGGQDGQGEQIQDQESAPDQQHEQSAAPTPTSVIAIEGESPAATSVPESDPGTSDPISVITIEGDPPASTPAATPPPAAAESERDAAGTSAQAETAQVFMTSALYGFPGEPEADAWLAGQRERLVTNGASGSGTFSEVADAPVLGDASVTFATQRQAGAGEEVANGFRFYSRIGAIIAVLEIGSTSDLPLDDAARIMELQVGCVEADGCNGVASLSGRLVGAVETAAPEEDDQAETAEPRPDRAAEPRPERQPREGRDQQQQPPVEAPPAEEPAPPPVEEPTPIPIEEPTEVPIEEPTQPPIEEGTPPPAEEGTPPPAEEPTPPPGEEPTPPPAEEPTPPPAEEPTQVPSEEPTPPPAEEPTQVPGEPTPPPVAEPTAIPTPGPIVEDDEPPADDGGGDGGGRDDRGRDDRDRDRDRGRDRD